MKLNHAWFMSALTVFLMCHCHEQQKSSVLRDNSNIAEIELPAGWSSQDTSKAKSREGMSVAGALAPDKSMLIMTVFNKSSIEPDLDVILDSQIDLFRRSPTTKIQPRESWLVGGQPARFQKGTSEVKNGTLLVYWMTVEGVNEITFIQGSCHQTNQEKREAEIIQALRSFRYVVKPQ